LRLRLPDPHVRDARRVQFGVEDPAANPRASASRGLRSTCTGRESVVRMINVMA
jgi:hypothetical protein